jgi:hypothetical protein
VTLVLSDIRTSHFFIKLNNDSYALIDSGAMMFTCCLNNNMIKLVSLSPHQLQKHLYKVPSDSAAQAAIVHHHNVLGDGRMVSDK